MKVEEFKTIKLASELNLFPVLKRGLSFEEFLGFLTHKEKQVIYSLCDIGLAHIDGGVSLTEEGKIFAKESFTNNPYDYEVKNVYVIRHSKRDQIENPQEHKRVLLNEEGILMAQKFGENLTEKYSNVKVYSSPVERCIQTGECILKEFHNQEKLQLSDMLGEPGPFVYGDAWESFKNLGTVGVVECLENGKMLPNISSEEIGTKKLLDFIRKEAEHASSNTVLVFVTHDACVAPVINFLTGEYFCENHWIEFLGGLHLQFKKDMLTIKRI